MSGSSRKGDLGRGGGGKRFEDEHILKCELPGANILRQRVVWKWCQESIGIVIFESGKGVSV